MVSEAIAGPTMPFFTNGQTIVAQHEDAQLHKQSRCLGAGRVMGESPGTHGILLGASPIVGKARNIRRAYDQPAAGSPFSAGRVSQGSPDSEHPPRLLPIGQGPARSLALCFVPGNIPLHYPSRKPQFLLMAAEPRGRTGPVGW